MLPVPSRSVPFPALSERRFLPFAQAPAAAPPMELEAQWWTGQLAADIHQALRYKVARRGGDSVGEEGLRGELGGRRGTAAASVPL